MVTSKLWTGAALAAFMTLGAGVATVAALHSPAQAAGDMAAQKVDDFFLSDQNFLSHQLYRMNDAKAVVLVTFDSSSKAIRAEAPAIMALKSAYSGKGVELFLLDSKLGDDRDAVKASLKVAGLDAPVLFDYEQFVGEQLGVTRTAEAFVINPRTWKIAYRGPVSDGGSNLASDAVASLVAGKTVAVAQRQAKGELIAFPEKLKSAQFANISYAHTIAPMIKEKCATCHQPGGIGPMPLNSYEQIKGFAPMIREVVRTKRMPPFLVDERGGHFLDDDRLSPEQQKTLVHWVEAGAPRGTGADPLAKIKFQAPEWPLGKPDLIVDVPPAEIPATGVMEYQRPAVKAVMTEGRWMKATAFRVENKAVVHHILTGVVTPDQANSGSATETQWGASLGGYGPGRGSNISPPDMGTWVPPAGGIGFQNHYTPFGKAVTEKTQMGIYFYPKGQDPKYVMRTNGIFDFTITIPANEEYHPEVAYMSFPRDAVLYGLTPHAHHRGGSQVTSIRYPDGREEVLLALPRYDFNWQYEYFLKTPLKVPAGSKLISRWTFDNSVRNPGNPNHNVALGWGEQSDQEMLALYAHYRWVGETTKDQHPEWDKQMAQGTLMGIMDDNLDGKLEKTELKGKVGEGLMKYWAVLDKNKDGVLDQSELAVASQMVMKMMREKPPAATAAAPAATAAKPIVSARN